MQQTSDSKMTIGRQGAFAALPYSWKCHEDWLQEAKCFGRDSRIMSLAHFGERCLYHPQYPQHVPTFAELWGGRWTTRELIADHTPYPHTAPFVEQELRERLLGWMHGNPSG